MNQRSLLLSITASLFFAPLAYTIGSPSAIAAPNETLNAESPKVERFTAQSGNVDATLTFEPDPTFRYTGKNVRLQVTRQGKVQLDGLPKSREDVREGEDEFSAVPHAYQKSPLTVKDLDRDGEPEILIDYYTGGAHCCVYTLIHRYNPNRQTYEAIAFPTTHIGYELKDLNKDGMPEFVTADGGFAYAFSSFAGSGFPLKIWNYQNGKMVDVTKQYPTLVRNNAYRYWTHAQTIIRTQGDRETKGLLAAYLADKYTLGEKKDGWKNLRALYQADDRTVFFESLEKFLKESSYDR